MSRPSDLRLRPLLGTAGGFAMLVVLVWRLGVGPFLDGLRAIDARSVTAAAAITAVATVSAAWRWAVVARGLGVRLPLRTAVVAYYRSQFLNTLLPGGVLGDLDRAVDHGRRIDDVGRGVRSVAWERAAGQALQVGVAAAVLLVLPSPVRSMVPAALGAVAVPAALVLVCAAAAARRGGRSRLTAAPARWVHGAWSDLRHAVLARRAWPAIGAASLIAFACHTAVVLLAVHLSLPGERAVHLLPLAMVILVGSALPVHLAGWGPREGTAAWIFAAAGLGAANGVTVSTVYGVLVISSCLPGAAALLLTRRRRVSRGGLPAASRVSSEASHG